MSDGTPRLVRTAPSLSVVASPTTDGVQGQPDVAVLAATPGLPQSEPESATTGFVDS